MKNKKPKLNRCKRCLSADTKPGVSLDSDHICTACQRHDNRKNINWEAREVMMDGLCDKHFKANDYDCIIPVSGGKDSHYQAWYMTRYMGLNPLLVSVTDPFTKTKAGIHNWKNIREVFNLDCITYELSPNATRKMMRIAFEEFGSPTWPIDRAIYVAPLRIAVEMGIPLVVYGENTAYEYGGIGAEDTPYANNQIFNDVAKNVDFKLFFDNGVDKESMLFLEAPSRDILAKINPIYLSYFTPWSGTKNLKLAKSYGFKTLSDTGEWKRDGYIDDYDQIDSIGYLFNVWMKYVKFGFGRVTDVVGYRIRDGSMKDIELADNTKDIELAEDMIRNHDHKLDRRILEDFMDFTGYSKDEIKTIVRKHFVRWDDELKK